MRKSALPRHTLGDAGSDPSASLDRFGRNSDRSRLWSNVVPRLVGCCVAVLIPTAILAALCYRLPEPTRKWWLGESGPVEMASGWGYVLLAIGLLAIAAIRFGKSRGKRTHSTREGAWHAIGAPALLGACAATLAAREFDWHNIWTTRSALKTRFYIDPEIAAGEKLATLVVLFSIGFLVVTTVRVYRSRLLHRLQHGDKAGFLVATGIAVLPLSKALDSGPSIFRRFLPDDPTNVRRFLGSFEEIIELAVPAMFLTAAMIAFWPRRSSEAVDREADQPITVSRSRRAA